MKKTTCITALAILLGAQVAFGAEVRFAKVPSASRAGDKVTVSFAVSAKTDVEVAVLDARGEVVRHLAAGVLGGEKDPPAPLARGLAQSLAWDGKDDFGEPARGGPYKFRVRCGLGAKFGRLIGGDPYTFGEICGLAADEDGDVYIMGFRGRLNQRQMTIRVFSPKGRYLREILPFPSNLEPGDMKDVARWDDERKTFRPRGLTSLNPNFYSGGRGGRLTLVSASKKNGVLLTDGTRIFTLEARGAVRGAKFETRTMWEKKLIPWGGIPNTGKGPVCLAASPDGKYVYECGIFTCKNKYGHKLNPALPPGRIFRLELGGGGFMKEFVTVKVAHTDGNGGNWTKGMGYGFGPNGPLHNMTVDAKGNVYVCDREHERVGVYDPSGKLVNEVPIRYAHQVAVHPETGAVYVLQKDRKSYGEYHAELFKFAGLGKGQKPVTSVKFDRKANTPQMALSVGEDRSVVWVAGVEGGLKAFEDKGNALQEVQTEFKPGEGVQLDWNRLTVDGARDEVYVSDGATRIFRYDGKTGEGGVLKRNGKVFFMNGLAIGYDGNLYVRVSGPTGTTETYSGSFWRLDRDLKPVPFKESGTHELSKYIYSRYGIGYAERGIGCAPDGKVYISWMFNGWVKYAVTAFGADGRPLKGKYPISEKGKGCYKRGTPQSLDSAIISPICQANGGIRVDLEGNIYCGLLYWPKDAVPPHGFDLKDRKWSFVVGSVARFTPEGGRTDEGQAATKVEGATAFYPGLAPFSRSGLGGNTCCVCRTPRFDLDRYGRLALPNAVTNSVWIRDNAGNLIAEIGRYGNFDSQLVLPGATDGKPLVEGPEIPLCWPTGAGFGRNSLYVNDTYSRRVVRADLTWAQEATCPAAGGAASVVTPAAQSTAPKAAEKAAGSEKPAGPRASKSEEPAPKAAGRSPARVCAGWFSMAGNYRKAGMTDGARRYLNKIISAYPESEWAAKARQELSGL